MSPQPSVPELDSSFRNSPLRHARVLFVRFVQGLLHAAPPGSYHWDPDDLRSEIIIRGEGSLDPQTVGKRPGITFTRGPVTFWSVGLDDMSEYDFATGRKVKDVIVPGTMTINCTSRFELECEDLAWTVTEHIWLLRHLLLKAGFFEIGRQPQIGAASPAGSIIAGETGDEFRVVPVTIPFQMNRRSAFTPLNKTIVQNIVQSLSISQNRRFYSQGVPGNGANIHECPPPPFSIASDVRGRTPDPANTRESDSPQRVPHPLKPAKLVYVTRPYPNRSGQSPRATHVPIKDPCVEESLK